MKQEQNTSRPEMVPSLFARQAAAFPERLAVDCVDGTATFADLERRSRTLARRLLTLGVGPDTVVALLAPRERVLIEALLAIWRAGAAFLLLDPHDPYDLTCYKLAASETRLLLCSETFAHEWKDAPWPVVVLEAPSPLPDEGDASALPEVAEHDLAYVVFTSGSTGRPKGVMIEHGGLAEHVATQLTPLYEMAAPLGTALRVGGAAPVSFDSFIDQVLPMVALGHTLVLFDERGRISPECFLDQGPASIDVVDCTPSQLTLLVEHGLLERRAPLRLIVFGGESPNQHTWEQVRASGVPAVSIYGATECTIGSMAAVLSDEAQVTLGFAAGSARVYVLDEANQVVPPGMMGEICLAGPGVGRGFVGAPGETARCFVPDPFSTSPGARMYRTGDLGMRDTLGRLSFCGRRDEQVKIRGFRIEPAEVEDALLAVPGVFQAVVLPAPFAGVATHLLAFLVGLPNLDWREIRETIARRLPAHMVPARAIQLDTFPLTRNGKVDRRALAALESARLRSSAPEPPVSELEIWVHDLWRTVLKCDLVGVNDDFETLGGQSLAAIEIIAQIRASFRKPFDVQAALTARTVREMAAVLARAGDALVLKEGLR